MTALCRSLVVSPGWASLAIALVSLVTLAGAWAFELWGYAPCKLCLEQRWAYYLAVPAGIVIWLAAVRPDLQRIGLLLLAFVFLGNALFGAYHAGIEWGFWPGPADCGIARPMQPSASVNDFMQQLSRVQIKSCNEAALRIMGLSLAGWNGLIALALAAFAACAAAHGSRTVSQ